MGDPTGDMTTQEDLRALRDYVLLNERPQASAWRFVAKTAERAADRIDTLEAALRKMCDYCARPVCSNIAREELEGAATHAAPAAIPPRAHSARCDCVQCQVYRILIAREALGGRMMGSLREAIGAAVAPYLVEGQEQDVGIADAVVNTLASLPLPVILDALGHTYEELAPGAYPGLYVGLRQIGYIVDNPAPVEAPGE